VVVVDPEDFHSYGVATDMSENIVDHFCGADEVVPSGVSTEKRVCLLSCDIRLLCSMVPGRTLSAKIFFAHATVWKKVGISLGILGAVLVDQLKSRRF